MAALLPGRIYYGELAPGEWLDKQGFFMPLGEEQAQQVLHLKLSLEGIASQMKIEPSGWFLWLAFYLTFFISFTF